MTGSDMAAETSGRRPGRPKSDCSVAVVIEEEGADVEDELDS